MPNMGTKIGAQNNRVEMNSRETEKERTCDCPRTKGGKPFNCKWGGKCFIPGMVYKCKSIGPSNKENWNYIGLTGGK